MRRGRPNEAGLTLVELMVALALAAMLSAGLYQLMSGQSRGYSQQLDNLTSQENLWGALEFLQRSVRQAGYGLGGCPGGRILRYANATASTTPAPWLIPLRVYNDCNLLLVGDPAVDCASGHGDGVDSLSVAFVGATPGTPTELAAARLKQAMAGVHALAIVDSPGRFPVGEHVALWQPGTNKPCTMLRVTAAPLWNAGAGGYELPHLHGVFGPDVNPPVGVEIFPAGGYDAGTLVLNVSGAGVRHFAVESDPLRPEQPPRLVTWSTANPHPSLDTANAEVVADGVEDLQIAYGCDENGNGVFDEGRLDIASGTDTRPTDEWAHNGPGEAGDLNGDGHPDALTCARGIGAVRLTVTARSPSPDTAAPSGGRAAAENRAAGPNDRYQRRRLTVLVTPRNLRATP